MSGRSITVASRCRITPMELEGLIKHASGGDAIEGYAQLTASDMMDAMQTVTHRMKELCQVLAVVGEGVVPLATETPSAPAGQARLAPAY